MRTLQQHMNQQNKQGSDQQPMRPLSNLGHVAHDSMNILPTTLMTPLSQQSHIQVPSSDMNEIPHDPSDGDSANMVEANVNNPVSLDADNNNNNENDSQPTTATESQPWTLN